MNIKIEAGAKVQITDKPIVNVFGDVVQHKEIHIHPEANDKAVEEVEVVEEQKVDKVPCEEEGLRNEELFHFVRPELDEAEMWRIHDAVKRVVANYSIPDICKYLKEQKQNGKLMLPSNPSVMYKELIRLGMPNGKGFSEKNFSNSYTK